MRAERAELSRMPADVGSTSGMTEPLMSIRVTVLKEPDRQSRAAEKKGIWRIREPYKTGSQGEMMLAVHARKGTSRRRRRAGGSPRPPPP